MPQPSCPPTREDLENRRIMNSIYSGRYNRKHKDERNRQTRERMAHLRAQDAVVSPEELEARLVARREAARKYREKNRRKLALKARQTRLAAKGAKEHEHARRILQTPESFVLANLVLVHQLARQLAYQAQQTRRHANGAKELEHARRAMHAKISGAMVLLRQS
ncbi:hypothetical protein C8F04DRAFT_1256073 [Mycena alexandri]|uniref:Uncharacterized protein n=1 Tax=Mycena alexandri TaxID=1745969 RepID=A0AAD6T2X5_9AGAR|nr:hypothetical protein C8F04DRAFT_1256073 [Mycena alexandri]